MLSFLSRAYTVAVCRLLPLPDKKESKFSGSRYVMKGIALLKLSLRNLTAFTALIGSLVLTSAAHAQLHFNFTFNAASGTSGGSGVLDLSSDPGNGTFLYSSLAPTYTFTVNGDTYTEANYTSNPSLSELVISDAGAGVRSLAFSNTGTNGGGAQGGSVDLVNGTNILSFSPSGYPGTAYYENTSGVAGYSASTAGTAATPEPGTWALLGGLGLTGGSVLVRRRKK